MQRSFLLQDHPQALRSLLLFTFLRKCIRRHSVSCVCLPHGSELSLALFAYLSVLCSGPQSLDFPAASPCVLGSFNDVLFRSKCSGPQSLSLYQSYWMVQVAVLFGGISLEPDEAPISPGTLHVTHFPGGLVVSLQSHTDV